MSRSGSRGRRHGTSSSPCCSGSLAIACSPWTPRSAANCAQGSCPTPRPWSGSSPKISPPQGSNAFPGSSGCATATPLLADQQILQVANVIWCTGSGPDFAWIDLPAFGENEHEPTHHRGVVANQPGLYFVGLSFLYAMSSGFLPGVDRDAEHIVHAILAEADGTSDRPGPAVDNGIRRPMRAR